MLLSAGVYVSPTWHDYPSYQWGLQGYPERMNTMFRTFGHEIERGVGVLLIWGSVFIVAYYFIPKIILFFFLSPNRIFSTMDWRFLFLVFLGSFIISLFTSYLYYRWHQPDEFYSDPFLFGYRERIQQTLKIQRIREWLTTQGYQIEHLPPRQDETKVIISPAILDMFRLQENQYPLVEIQQHLLWIVIDGGDEMRFGLAIGAFDSPPPQIWRCLPFERGTWVFVEDMESGDNLNDKAKNACN